MGAIAGNLFAAFLVASLPTVISKIISKIKETVPEEKPKDKIVVKFNTTYNKQIESDYEINSISEFKNTLEKILNHVSSL